MYYLKIGEGMVRAFKRLVSTTHIRILKNMIKNKINNLILFMKKRYFLEKFIKILGIFFLGKKGNIFGKKKVLSSITINYFIEILVFSLLAIIFLSYIIHIFSVLADFNYGFNLFNKDIISFIKEANEVNGVKGDIELDKVKIEGLDTAIHKIRDGGVYVGGMAAAAKVVKGSSMPVGAKLGAVVGMGAASLIGFNMAQHNMSASKTKNLNIEVDKINTSVTTSVPKDKPCIF